MRSVFDLIIKNGNIIDGTGSKPRKSDIGINGDKIISIGDLKNQEAKTIVDAEGLCVSPGFIDTHSHADFDILRDPQHIYGISQGVTTEILSPDGIGIVPLDKSKSKKHIDYLSGILGHPPEDFDGTSFESAKKFYHKKSKINVAVFAGHGPLRLNLTAMNDIPLEGDLLKKAKYKLEESLEQGAAGFSTGLDYYPQTFSNTQELIELSKVAKSKNRVYSVHLRSHEKHRAFANGGILEAIEVARRSEVSLLVEHYRTVEETAGQIDVLLEPVEKAKKEGVDITMETYSYPVGCTIPLIFFPGDFHLGGIDNIMSILADQEKRDYWEKEMSQFSEINSLLFIHDDDGWEDSMTLSFLIEMNKVRTINYTNFGCEPPFNNKYGAHIFPIYPEKDSCFTKWEAKNNYIINYLEELF